MLSQTQRDVLSALQQPGCFLKMFTYASGVRRVYLYRRTWTAENMGPLHSYRTFVALRDRGLINAEEGSAGKRWIISGVGRKVLQRVGAQREG